MNSAFDQLHGCLARRRTGAQRARGSVRWALPVVAVVGVATLAPTTRAEAPAAATPATAPPSNESVKGAALRFARQGQQALDAKRFDDAAAQFEQAYALVPAPTFAVRLAQARVGQGRLQDAHELYARVVEEGVPQHAPAAFHKAHAEAKAQLAPLAAQLAEARIVVFGAPPEQVDVKVNGVTLPPGALGTLRLYDPGSLRVEALAPGYRPAQVEAPLQKGQRDLVVELRLTPVVTAVATSKAAAPPVVLKREDRGVHEPSVARVTGYVALGLGTVAAGFGGYFGLSALERDRNTKNLCGPSGRCTDAAAQQAASRAKAARDEAVDRADWSWMASGGLALTGALLVWLGPAESSAPQPLLGFCGPSTPCAGLSGRF